MSFWKDFLEVLVHSIYIQYMHVFVRGRDKSRACNIFNIFLLVKSYLKLRTERTESASILCLLLVLLLVAFGEQALRGTTRSLKKHEDLLSMLSMLSIQLGGFRGDSSTSLRDSQLPFHVPILRRSERTASITAVLSRGHAACIQLQVCMISIDFACLEVSDTAEEILHRRCIIR